MKIKIEKGIPTPVMTSKNLYPFKDMEIGDSFLVKTSEDRDRVRVSAIMYRQRGDAKFTFTLRKVENGYRFWRIAFESKPAAKLHNLKTA